jgi:hypothetical protein
MESAMQIKEFFPILLILSFPMMSMNGHENQKVRYKLCSPTEKDKGCYYSCWQPYDEIATAENDFKDINTLLIDASEFCYFRAIALSNGTVLQKDNAASFLGNIASTRVSYEKWVLLVEESNLQNRREGIINFLTKLLDAIPNVTEAELMDNFKIAKRRQKN